MEQLEFTEWLKDFYEKNKNDKFGGYEAAKFLKIEVGMFPPEKRISFIDELININSLATASELIELYGSYEQKRLIREKAKELLDSKSDDRIIVVFILTIIRTFEISDTELLRKYYLEQHWKWFRVDLELYYVDKLLFLYAIEINLKKIKDEHLYNYDGFLYLLKDFEILEFLIDNLSTKQSKRMKEFCKVKSNHSIVNKPKWKEELIRLSKK